MSGSSQLSARDRKKIEVLVQFFRDNRLCFEGLLEQLISSLRSDQVLAEHVHSLKWRVKDCDHLRDKLERKFVDAKAEKKQFDITIENLFEKINDLAGCRILHLYTKQFEPIHQCLNSHFQRVQIRTDRGPYRPDMGRRESISFCSNGHYDKEKPIFVHECTLRHRAKSKDTHNL